MNYIDFLAQDKNIMLYRPELKKITGSTNSAILLSQVIYYASNTNSGEFYKFKSPCTHPKYVAGDSWIEKLGFSEKEFDGALANIAFKKGKSKKNVSEEEAFVFFYTDMERCTWYSINAPALNKALEGIYVNDKREVTYTTKGDLRNRQKVIYVTDKKGDTIVTDKREVSIVTDKKGDTIHTEINIENTHREEIFEERVFELSDFPSEKNTSPLKTEKEKENTFIKLGDFEIQSKNEKVFALVPKNAKKETIETAEAYQIPFSEFWEKYKKKEGKVDAEKVWKKINDADREIIMNGIDNYASRPDNEKDNRKYQPYASTFLNQKRYLDDNYSEKITLTNHKSNGNANLNPRNWDEETGNIAAEFLFGSAR